MTRTLLFLILATFLLCATGCVERHVTIESDPSEATVYVNNKLIGVTPVSMTFTHYGNMAIRIEKAGYVTLVGTMRLRRPWYQTPVVDFFSENLYPGTAIDRQSARFTLIEATRADADKMIEESKSMSRYSTSEDDQER